MLAGFAFEDALRPDARDAVAALKQDGMRMEILSGDRRSRWDGRRQGLAFHIARRVLPGAKVERMLSHARPAVMC